MAGNFAKPVTTDLYTDILTIIKENQIELAKMLDGSTATSIPVGAKRWNTTNKRFEKYDGSAWTALIPDATTSAAGFLTAADKIKIDGLGTGSATDKQTSAYDATAGSLLILGAFGLGGISAQSLSIENALDAIAQTGFYQVSAAYALICNAPVASAGVILHQNYGASNATQIYMAVGSSSVVYTRTKASSVWSAWVKLLHTGNILNTDIPVDSIHRWTTDAEKTAWNAKAAASHTHVINDLSDVIQSAAASGELLKFNGTNWVNNTLAEAGVAAASHTHPYAGAATAGGAATSAAKLATARSIALTGDVTGSASFDGSAAVSIAAVVANDSHTHATQYLAKDVGHGAIGSFCFARVTTSRATSAGETVSGSLLYEFGLDQSTAQVGSTLSGTWRCLGCTGTSGYHGTLYQRIS